MTEITIRKMTRKAYLELPPNHKWTRGGQSWAVWVQSDGSTVVGPVELDGPPAVTITDPITERIWIVDYCAVVGGRKPTTRANLKAVGATIAYSWREGGETTRQIWRDKDGNCWYGDDWYYDSRAVVYPCYQSPF